MPVNGYGCLPAGDHGLYCDPRTGDRLTRCKDPLQIGCPGDGVHIQGVIGADLQVRITGQKGEVRGLAQGRYDHIYGHHEFGIRDGYGSSASPIIRLSQFHAHAFQSGHTTVFSQNLDRCHQIFDPDPFELRGLDLILYRRHLQPGPAVKDGDLLCAQAKNSSGGINGGISPADDCDPVSHIHLFPQIHITKELRTGNDTP